MLSLYIPVTINNALYIVFNNVRYVVICVTCELSTENKSETKMLNKSGLRIEPCGTPNNISSQELYDEFILVLCFL